MMVAGTSGRWYEAELHRLKGDLLLHGGDPTAAAEVCYERAMAVAARQGARLWQLRAANALASIWSAQGRLPEVHSCLASLCATFGETVISVDLRQAKALLASIT